MGILSPKFCAQTTGLVTLAVILMFLAFGSVLGWLSVIVAAILLIPVWFEPPRFPRRRD